MTRNFSPLVHGTENIGFQKDGQKLSFAEQFMFFLPSTSLPGYKARTNKTADSDPDQPRQRGQLHLAKKNLLQGKCALSLADDCQTIDEQTTVRLKPANILRILTGVGNVLVNMSFEDNAEGCRKIAEDVIRQPSNRTWRNTAELPLVARLRSPNTDLMNMGIAGSVSLMAELSARRGKEIHNLAQWRIQGVEISSELAGSHSCPYMQDMIRFALDNKDQLGELGLTRFFDVHRNQIPPLIIEQGAAIFDVKPELGELIVSQIEPKAGIKIVVNDDSPDQRFFGIDVRKLTDEQLSQGRWQLAVAPTIRELSKAGRG